MNTNGKFPNESFKKKILDWIVWNLMKILQYFFSKKIVNVCVGKGSVCSQMKTRTEKNCEYGFCDRHAESMWHYKQTNKHNMCVFSLNIPYRKRFRRKVCTELIWIGGVVSRISLTISAVRWIRCFLCDWMGRASYYFAFLAIILLFFHLTSDYFVMNLKFVMVIYFYV